MVKFRLRTGAPAADQPPLRRAAAYVRMSTEHQTYSPANQRAGIERFAVTHGFLVVRTYADEGQSGLQITGRRGLQTLLADVARPDRDFEAVLVLDVSRWGRFQDVDQSAYYEYLCRQAGVQVHYCSEAFANDGTPMASLLKSMKRVMAAEYSEELSRKTSYGKQRLARLGFWVSGSAGFGYRRQLVSASGELGQVMEPGEEKRLASDRVTLVPGPAEEVATIRALFRAFVDEQLSIVELTRRLHRGELAGCAAQPWCKGQVRRILADERYIGTLVYNRSRQRLRGKITANPADQVVRVEGAFEGILDPELFLAARQRIARLGHAPTDAELLERLARYAQHHVKVTKRGIDADRDMPWYSIYHRRFGGLKAALACIRQHKGEADDERDARTAAHGERQALATGRAASPAIEIADPR